MEAILIVPKRLPPDFSDTFKFPFDGSADAAEFGGYFSGTVSL